MKLVLRIKLLPTPPQASALEATLRACNQAADHVSAVAHAEGTTDIRALRARTCTHLKNHWNLGAQAAQHVIKKTRDAYASLYTGSEEHLRLLDQYRRGESDLLTRNGQWHLMATLDIPDPPQNPAPHGFIGVDLGIADIATAVPAEAVGGNELQAGEYGSRVADSDARTSDH